MEITSLKTSVKEQLEMIDNFTENLPKLEISLSYNERLNNRIVDDLWIKWINIQGDLNRTIYASEYLQSNIKEAISILNSNLELEINQKNMLKKSLDILDIRTKPLKTLIMPIQNIIYYLQSQSRVTR